MAIEDDIAEGIRDLIIRMLPTIAPATEGIVRAVRLVGGQSLWSVELSIAGIDPDPLPVARPQWFSTFITQVADLGDQLVGRKVLVQMVDSKPVIMGTVG